MSKKCLALLLSLALLVLPLSGMTMLSATALTAPTVSVNIDPYDTVAANTTITVTYNGAASCDTRLEGTSLGTDSTVSFTPASRSLADGLYTMIMESTDANGIESVESLTFYVDSDAEIDSSASGATVTTFEADALDFTAGYGSTADGTIDLSADIAYGDYEQYQLQYTDEAVSAASASGIPYQTFDIDLAGKTSGQVAVSYSGATKEGERIAVKAYNVGTATWDTLGTFLGEGSVSELIDIATYNDGGKIHVMAMLDYVTNGSNTMIWSTDPQHYTKFTDLYEYYYKVYQFAAEQYVSGEVGYIMTTGDLVDDRPTATAAIKQWQVSNQAMSYVEAVGMPNGLESGNHDVGDNKLPDYSAGDEGIVNYSKYLEYYPATRYNNERWYGGSLNNNISHYDLVTIGNVDFIVLYLGYGLEATDETIAWANDVLATYSHRTAIVATHEYLDATLAVRAETGRGQLIYEKIVDPNPNVKMVVCGHDDGSLCLEKTASDGRTVYEILADYQFVEAEDPSFYANEHWIGQVPSCCGDGYIRLMTVEGDTLSSITYSPVTGRYNPYGDRENLTLDLDCGTPDRAFSTTRFSAAVLGTQTASTAVDHVSKITDGVSTSYTAVTYAAVPTAPTADDTVAWPDTTYGVAATPSNPYYQHAAKEAPLVDSKVDLLEALGLGAHPTANQWVSFGNLAMNLNIDLNETPYLYYSFAQPSGSNFTFALYNNATTAPWLTFLDNTQGGATLNSGAENWDAYASTNAQYHTTSATGCIDLRTLLTDSTATSWIINQINFYNQKGHDVVISYLFVGSAPSSSAWPDTTYGKAATPTAPFYAHAAKEAPAVEHKVDLLDVIGVTDHPTVTAYSPYGDQSLGLQVDLSTTPYLYYSFALEEGSSVSFAFINSMTYAPWLTFLDNTKGGTTLNNGAGTFNGYTNHEQYFTDSITGCIDLRTLTTDPNAIDWIINQVNFYNYTGKNTVVSYFFLGSAALGADGTTSADATALQALIAKANATDTTGYTTASVKALQDAVKVASTVNDTNSAAVAAAYHQLSAALGALTMIETTIDESSLVSIKNYSLNNSNWICNSTGAALTSDSSYLDLVQTDDGMILSHSTDSATHTWPQARYVGSGSSYTVNPYGGIYMKLDVDADASWAITLYVTQDGGETKYVRLNPAIDNAFHNYQADGKEGVYQGIYDVSQAFIDYGVDPTATFTVEHLVIFVIGGDGAKATYNHIELMTGASAATDRTELESLVAYANLHTRSLYTTATWSALQTAVSEANTALADTSLTQPALNIYTHNLRSALEALVLVTQVEPDGSLLPDDLGLWQPDIADAISVRRDADNNTVIQNSNSYWPRVDHVLDDPMFVSVADSQIELDLTVGSAANLYIVIDGEWISLSKYIDANKVDGNDLQAGDYRVSIPLSELPSVADKVAVSIEAVRVYAVGEAASSAVTIRRFAIDDYCDCTWTTATTYGPAATPANPFYAHCAKNEPLVATKVDVLAALGLHHPDVSGYESYGANPLNMTIDLNETPYLYYSFAVPAGGNFTFGFFNDTSTAPYFAFLDAAAGNAVMNSTVATWDAYTACEQYATTGVTGCIDMRSLLNDASNASWILDAVSFYNTSGKNVEVSYLFFGSDALSDGYVEDPVTLGDVDGDGTVSSIDARLILSYLLNDLTLTDVQLKAADVNENGIIDTTDIRLILQTLIS